MRDKEFNQKIKNKIKNIRNMMDINMELLQQFINFMMRKLLVVVLRMLNLKQRTSRRITQTNYQKIQEKKITFNFYRQYLGRRSSRYGINK